MQQRIPKSACFKNVSMQSPELPYSYAGWLHERVNHFHTAFNDGGRQRDAVVTITRVAEADTRVITDYIQGGRERSTVRDVLRVRELEVETVQI